MEWTSDLLGHLAVVGYLGGGLLVARLLVWLAGYYLTIRDARGKVKSELIRAYGASLPRMLSRVGRDRKSEDEESGQVV